MTWSSQRMPEESLDRMFRDLETDPTGADPSHRFDWTIGAHKQVRAGDMAIFYRQASENNGVFAIGDVVGVPYQTDNSDDRSWYVEVQLIRRTRPWEGLLLTREQTLEFLLPAALNAQASGYPIHLEPAELQAFANCILTNPITFLNDLEEPASGERIADTVSIEQLYFDELPALLVSGALEEIGVTERERRALVELWSLPGHSGSPIAVSQAAEFSELVEANRCITEVGNRIAERLDLWQVQEDHPLGYEVVVLALSSEEGATWIMRPSFVIALQHLEWVDASRHAGETISSFEEGERRYLLSISHERLASARKAALEAHGFQCSVCGFDFQQVYGELGRRFIEVHHIDPIHRGSRKTNPRTDLIPVCPNCHAMIHRFAAVTPAQLRYVINQQQALIPAAAPAPI
jgi:predicted HNH restriction endonuclease